MKMNFFRRLLLTWMIVWLPVAGAMAAVMPISGATITAAANVAASEDSDLAMPCHGTSVPGNMLPGQSCSHCVLCHLAGALATPAMPAIAPMLPISVFIGAPVVPYPSFIPEPASPPPRAISR